MLTGARARLTGAPE